MTLRSFKSLLALGALSAGLLSASAATHTVQVGNNFFSPANLTIAVGDTVTWVNNSGGHHDAVARNGTFRSPLPIPRTQPFSFTFNTAGRFDYVCGPHEFIGMVGAIIVQQANTPPVVSITAPGNGASFLVGQAISFSANATDNGSVTKVDFFANGNSIGTDNSAPYSISVDTLGAGNYAITARATDNLNATTLSAPVNISVTAPVNQPPTVAITGPASESLFQAPANFNLQATASDPDGSVAQVEFFNGGISLGTATSSPFSLSVQALAAGRHSITAVARDNLGLAGAASAELIVNVAAIPHITSITETTENEFRIVVAGTTGIPHILERATDAANNNWSPISTNSPARGSTSFTDTAAGASSKFYRVVVK